MSGVTSWSSTAGCFNAHTVVLAIAKVPPQWGHRSAFPPATYGGVGLLTGSPTECVAV